MTNDELPQTLLGQCVIRAAQVHAQDELDRGRDPDVPPTRVETMKAMWRSVADGGKIAALVCMWAIALDELGVDELRVEEFVAWSSESRATVHNRLAEFRRAWPSFETPNELALLILEETRTTGQRIEPNVGLPAIA